MSVFALSFLSMGPRVTREGERLVANTSLPFRIATLFSWNKRLEACPREGKVVLKRTMLWTFTRTTEIPFQDIREINYKYSNLMPLSSVSATDAIDCYTILLELHDRHEIKLFSWIGQGEFENNSLYPDWVYWDEYIVDFTGTQANASLAFFELLRGMWKGASAPALQGNAAPSAPPLPRQKPGVRPAPPPPAP